MGLKTRIKLWLENEKGYVFGEGIFKLLEKIQELGTLRSASEELAMSYRQAWGMIKQTELRIGRPLLKTRKGGPHGGGGAELTAEARLLMEKYLEIKKNLKQINETLDFI